MQITNCTFDNNHAINGESDSQSGNGGAIAFTGSDEITQLEFTSNNTFINNTADVQGGAIYWNYVEPLNIETVNFDDNQAQLYGNDIACFAQEVISISQDEYNSGLSRRLSTEVDTSDNSVSSQLSGGTLPDIHLALIDKYGVIINIDSGSFANLAIANSELSSTYTASIRGVTAVQAYQGMYRFTDIYIIGEPGLEYMLTVQTTGIDGSKQSNIEYLEELGEDSFTLSIDVQLDYCQVGQVLLITGECYECPGPLEYSLLTSNESLS